MAHRTWASLGDELLGHYSDAIGSRSVTVNERAPRVATPPTAWKRYVALGDSLTEGLSDGSRQANGHYRGWADRLAELLAHSGERRNPLLYANLAVRSRRIADVVDHQLPRALELGADLVSVLVGANDLVRLDAQPEKLAERLGEGIARLRESGADVLVVTAFAPHRRYLRPLHERLARFNTVLTEYAMQTDCLVLDFAHDEACAEARTWGEDRVHLSSQGHRVLSYRAAAALGVPGAGALGSLDVAMHDEDSEEPEHWMLTPQWLWTHVRPWAARRVLGRTAGDGLEAKHHELVAVSPRRRVRASR